ncbi:MAG: hypothetical protein M3Y77_14095 [Actinomycetota bacterium]|nr:hypothetical protein [Actinomycetota bacterium]
MKLSRLLSVFSLVAAAVVIPATSAAAAPISATVSSTGQYCAMYLPTGAHACVDRPESIGVARTAIGINANGRNESAPTDGTLLTYHIGTVYDDDLYSTAHGYYEFYVSADCTASKSDSNWQNQDLGNIGWRDRISSFHSFGNCQTRLFSATNFGGSGYPANGFITDSSNVGSAMNDHARSIKWT